MKDSLSNFEMFFEDMEPPRYWKEWIKPKPSKAVMLSKLRYSKTTAKR